MKPEANDFRRGPLPVLMPKSPKSSSGGGAWISFAPSDDFTAEDDAFSATITAVHGRVPDEVGDEVTIINTGNTFSGGVGSAGICAFYDEAEDAYFCVQMACRQAWQI